MHKKINLCKIIFAVWAVCVCGFLVVLRSEIWNTAMKQGGYVRLMELGLILGIVTEYIAYQRNNQWSEAKKIWIIFLTAFCIRTIALVFSYYVPSMDFYAYFTGACNFANYGFRTGLAAELAGFRIPAFGGQAVFNGLLLRILSPTLLGMQLLNAIYTSGICVWIYILGGKFNERTALIGAILYTFYPMSILSTQITTNHHGATFFILLGIFVYNRAVNEEKAVRRVIYVAVSAVCFVISNCYHPSIVIVLCALLVNALINEIEELIDSSKTYFDGLVKEVKHFKGRLCVTIAVIILYELLFSGIMNALAGCGYIDSARGKAPWGKIVVGLNQETKGGYSRNDYDYVNSLSDEEKSKVCIEIIKERLSDPERVADLMAQKTKDVWFRGDNYCYFYTVGIYGQIQEKTVQTDDRMIQKFYEELRGKIGNVIGNIDTVNDMFVYAIWVFAVIGVAKLIFQYRTDREIYLLIFIPIGWMLFITFTEAQSRYRYQSMPVLILLAGIGINTIMECVKFIRIKLGRKEENIIISRSPFMRSKKGV